MVNIYEFCDLSFAGRLTKDPVFDTNKKGTAQAKITIARSKYFRPKGSNPDDKGTEITTFLPCYVYGDYLIEKLKKASKGYWILVKADFCPLKNSENDMTSVGFVIEAISCIIPPQGHSGDNKGSDTNSGSGGKVELAIDDHCPF